MNHQRCFPVIAGAVAVLASWVSIALPQQVPYQTEAEAVAAGRERGIGSAALEGPVAVEVDTDGSWTLVYTAGKAGIRPGGGVRVGMRHLLNWTPPQTENPKARGYFTAEASGEKPVRVFIPKGGRHFFGQYFAWQHMVEVTLPEEGLAPGETLRLTYGDRRGGSPGVRVQPFDGPRYTFKFYVDALGDDDYLPLAENPSVRIVAAEPVRLAVVSPSDAVAGEPTWCLVRAEDRYGNPADRYRGSVLLETPDPPDRLPPAHTFTEADRGAYRFENVVFRKPGVYRIGAGDGTLEAEGNPVRVVSSRPAERLLWGDLHGHTLFSDGRGTVEEYYDFAENVAALDFCAVTDHAFEIVDWMWEHSKRVTNARNEPGRFVTFQGYEWSGNTAVGGDHNVYFVEDDPPLFRSDNYYHPRNLQMDHGPEPKVPHVEGVFAELRKRLREKNVFCIPHYGGRRGNPAFHDPKVQRMIEIMSEHRRSEDWAGTFLARGHRLGIIASGDDHFGNPGYGYLRPTGHWDTQEIGMALVAVYAPEQTRESIFRALYDRRVYATSGDRIVLDFRVDGHPMGTEYEATESPKVHVEAIGTAAITRVEIKRNGKIADTAEPGQRSVDLDWQDPEFDPAAGTVYYYVRVLQENGEEAISSPVWVN